eukprot:6454798-Amphidinium_carterae.1
MQHHRPEDLQSIDVKMINPEPLRGWNEVLTGSALHSSCLLEQNARFGSRNPQRAKSIRTKYRRLRRRGAKNSSRHAIGTAGLMSHNARFPHNHLHEDRQCQQHRGLLEDLRSLLRADHYCERPHLSTASSYLRRHTNIALRSGAVSYTHLTLPTILLV